MKLLTLFLTLLLSTSTLLGQKIDTDLLEGINIRNVGPAGMSGRVTAIDAVISNPNIIYVGSASGGVWKSENAGVSWMPIFDDQPVQSCGSIKINQHNPSEIWVGTGEGNPRNSMNTGAGIYKTLDGGKTWNLMGLKDTKTIHRIIIHRDNPNIVFAGAMGSPWGPNADRGVFKTSDGGKIWKKVLYVNDKTGIADMVVDPSNPNKIIAAMWEYGRTPWDFNSGGKGSGLYITYDAGETWKRLTDKEGLPKGDLGRMGVAFSASKPNIVYALIEAKENALYKSTDGGEKWSKISTDDNIGNRPFYYSELYVNPNNENRVFSIYTYVSRSEDGGKTFKVIADYGNDVHPDHHAFWINPNNPMHIMDGNDGGMNISHDGGDTWQFVANLPIGQFYHVNVDNEFPYNIYGGMQDNGSWIGPAYVLKSGGIRNYDWQEVMFGDGFDIAPDPEDSRFGFGMSQGGFIGRWDRLTGATEFVRPVHPEDKELRFNWNAAFSLDPHNNSGLYYGSQYVHHSSDKGKSWQIISPDLTTNDTLKQQQHKSGGLTIDATGAENNTTILAIAPSPTDPNVIWVGTDDGNLQLTRDGGKSWTNLIDKIKTAPEHGWIPQIQVSESNAGEALVVINNYRQNDYSAHLYHTSDYGKTWKRLVDDQDVGGFVNAVVRDDKQPNLMFLGTDVGLYFSLDAGDTWNKWTKGFPSVQIRDMVIHPVEGDLVIASFGRAFWVMDDINPLRALAANKAIDLKKEFKLFEPQTAYITSRRSYDGIRFGATGEFVGDNRGYGAVITAWNKKKEEKKEDMSSEEAKESDEDDKDKSKKGKDDDKMQCIVKNMAGDTIRRFSTKLDKPGMSRFTWNMIEDGVSGPSRRKVAEDADPPRGNSVLPGKYQLFAEFNGQKDSIYITVADDPRLPTSQADIDAKREKLDQLSALQKEVGESFDQLKEAKESIALVEKLLVNQPDSIQKQVKEWNKAELETIKELEKLYMEEEGLKGIQRDRDGLSSKLGMAGFYIGSSVGGVGGNAENALSNVSNQSKEVNMKVSEYMKGKFAEYRSKIEGIELKLFK